MESLSSKEFFEQLNSNNLKPSFTLKGIVKKSEKGCMGHHFGSGCHHWHHEVAEDDHKK